MIKKKSLFIKVFGIVFYGKKGSTLNRFNSILSPTEYQVINSTKYQKKIKTFIQYIAPYKFSGELIRVGGRFDGSYVMPRELINYESYLISAGIESNNRFEISLATKGVRGIQIDNSIDNPPSYHDKLSFTKITLGNKDLLNEISLGTLIKRAPSVKSLIIKMDIEGGEIEVIDGTSINLLKKIECLILELHNLSSIFGEPKLLQILKKLHSSGLRPVFIQPNNACLSYTLGGSLIPDNMEITFVKRNKISYPDIKYIQKVKLLSGSNIRGRALVNIDHILLYNLVSQVN